MRKIIQLLDTPDNSTSQGYLTALCDDGTVWFYQGKWEPLEAKIPQDPAPTVHFKCQRGGDVYPCNPACENGCI